MKKIIILLAIIGVSFSSVFALEDRGLKPSKEFLQEQHNKNLLLAEQGDADAQYKLSINYSGVSDWVDIKKSIFWLKQSANNGNADAQYEMGLLHYTGANSTIPKDYNKALDWIKKSIKHGNARAQGFLATEYALGGLVEKDKKKEIYWLKEASKGGDAESQHFLGRMYLYGHDMLMDKKKGLYWLKNSANQDYIDSQKALAEHYLTGDLEKTADDGLYWLKKAAKLGDSNSQFEAGRYYNLAEKDYSESVKWLSMASDQDNKEAQGMLAGMYIFGKGVEKNLSKAKELIEKAYESNDLDIKERAKKKWEEFELWKY